MLTEKTIRLLFRDQLKRVKVSILSGALYGAALSAAVAYGGWLALRGRASLGDVALTVQVARPPSAIWRGPPGRRRGWPSCRSRASATCGCSTTSPPSSAGRSARRSRHRRPSRAESSWRGSRSPIRAATSRCCRTCRCGCRRARRWPSSGRTAAGKTSLVKLLCRFYDPTEGRILVDGVDLRDLDLEEWRERTSVAFQDFVRFQLVARESVAPSGTCPPSTTSSGSGRRPSGPAPGSSSNGYRGGSRPSSAARSKTASTCRKANGSGWRWRGA